MELVEAAATPPIPETLLRDWLRQVHQLATDLNTPLDPVYSSTTAKILLVGLLDTAYAPGLLPAHRAAACNFLCALLDFTRVARPGRLLGLLSECDAWRRMLTVFIERSDVSMPKSMRQVLTALTNALGTAVSAPGDRLELRDEAIRRTLSTVQHTSEHVGVRPAMQLLTHFLSKDVMTLAEVAALFESITRSSPAHVADSVPQAMAALYRRIFRWVSFDYLALPAAQLSTELFRHILCSDMQGMSPPPWQVPLLEAVQRSPEDLTNFRIYVFPSLFKLHLPAYSGLLRHCGLSDLLDFPLEEVFNKLDTSELPIEGATEELLFAALQVGKEIGTVQIIDDASAEVLTDKCVLIPARVVHKLLHARSPNTRLAGVSLAVSSPTTTTPLSASILRSLQGSLLHLLSEPDASFRGTLLSSLQRLLDRLRGAMAHLSKTVGKGGQGLDVGANAACVGQLRQHQSFVVWLYETALSALHPAATYSSHFSALRLLLMIAKSGIDPSIDGQHHQKQGQGNFNWPMTVKIHSSWAVRALQDLTVDPFDDVRQVTAVILGMSPIKSAADNWFVENLQALVNRAGALAQQTGRADQADGVGRTYALLSGFLPLNGQDQVSHTASRYATFDHLLSQLELSLSTARQSFVEAVRGSPLHGNLIALRYMLEQADLRAAISRSESDDVERWNMLFRRTCSIMGDIWTVVRPVLCDDAPEGFVLDEAEDDSDITTKDTLSYCWRALKESSSLIKALVVQQPSRNIDRAFISSTEFELLGELSFTQLSELRHRGAFSTVAQTFGACCTRSHTATDVASRALIDRWYTRTINAIEDKASFLTRRSAGLPSLMTSILTADAEGSRFHDAVRELVSIAERPTPESEQRTVPLPQVHAMNCLRAIFINSKLGVSSDSYVLEGLHLAASRLGSAIWAIRNSALMLFRALLDRMLGTFESGNSDDSPDKNRFSYANYPTLLDIVEGLLHAEADVVIEHGSSRAGSGSAASLEKVFPALHLLQRAPPPRSEFGRFVPLVLKLTSSPQWHVRDLAARSLVRLTAGTPMDQLLLLFPPIHTLCAHQNSLHGYLLFLVHLVRHRSASAYSDTLARADLSILFETLRSHEMELGDENACWVTRTAYVELREDLHATLAAIDKQDGHNATARSSNVRGAALHSSMFDPGSSPASTETMLTTWGSRLSILAEEVGSWLPQSEDLQRLASAVKSSLAEENTFTLRFAAVQALIGLGDFWGAVAESRSLDGSALDLMISTYDALNDDDEQIRDSATEVVHGILLKKPAQGSRQLLSPPFAAEQLLLYLIRRYGHHAQLCTSACKRLTATRDKKISVQATIAKGLEQDTTLFVEEKQNLYLDQVSEAARWSQVLKNLQSAALPRDLIHALTHWVVEGLQSVLATLHAKPDEALGWTSKPAVFVVAVQLLCTADVLLTWRSRTKVVPVSGATLRRMLYKVSTVGKANGLHPMLVLKTDVVLQQAALRRLSSLRRTLDVAVSALNV